MLIVIIIIELSFRRSNPTSLTEEQEKAPLAHAPNFLVFPVEKILLEKVGKKASCWRNKFSPGPPSVQRDDSSAPKKLRPDLGMFGPNPKHSFARLGKPNSFGVGAPGRSPFKLYMGIIISCRHDLVSPHKH